MKTLLLHIAVFALLCVLWACGGGDRALQSALDRADSLMETHPDSALDLLKPYDSTEIRSEAQRARFALLYSMTLDKNYIDKTDFKVLQPALDYYPTHGTDADKLRTLYYEGRIYENAKRMDKAMEAWAEALQYRGPKTDSLTLARLLVAQGNGYFNLYRIDRYISNNQQAENIYLNIGRKSDAEKAMIRAFNGALSTNDSLSYVYRNKTVGILKDQNKNGFEARNLALLREVRYGSEASVADFLEEFAEFGLDSLDMAQAWLKLGKPNDAQQVFPKIQTDKTLFGNVKYNRTKARVQAANSDYEGAWSSFNSYLDYFDRQLSEGATGDIPFLEERSEWSNKERQNQEIFKNTIAVGILIIVALILAAALFYTRIQKSRIQKLQIEEKLQKLILIHENTVKQAIGLEDENITLKSQYNELKEKGNYNAPLPNAPLPNAPLPKAIKERLAILDSFVKRSVSNPNKDSKDSVNSLFNLETDSRAFLENSGRTLAALYPAKSSELRKLGVTDEELGYLYLYLIGLNCKEICVLLNKKRIPYVKSSEIRKKLGLSPDVSNLGKAVVDIFGKSEV